MHRSQPTSSGTHAEKDPLGYIPCKGDDTTQGTNFPAQKRLNSTAEDYNIMLPQLSTDI